MTQQIIRVMGLTAEELLLAVQIEIVWWPSTSDIGLDTTRKRSISKYFLSRMLYYTFIFICELEYAVRASRRYNFT